MQVIAFTSHAAWYSFLTERRVGQGRGAALDRARVDADALEPIGRERRSRIAGPVMSSLGWSGDRLVHGASAFLRVWLRYRMSRSDGEVQNCLIARLRPARPRGRLFLVFRRRDLVCACQNSGSAAGAAE